jgi:hypothetical protein
VVTFTGPRQSDKTTLVKAVFPRHRYVSLESPEQREFAQTDPRGFLGQFDGPAIIEEAHRAADLFSYVQVSTSSPCFKAARRGLRRPPPSRTRKRSR